MSAPRGAPADRWGQSIAVGADRSRPTGVPQSHSPVTDDRYLRKAGGWCRREADFRDNARFDRLGTSPETFADQMFLFSEIVLSFRFSREGEA
jgi:hypothetical protein